MTAWHRVKIAICQWQTDKQDWQRGPLLRYYSNYWLRSKKMLQLQPMSFGVGQTDPCCSCLPPEYIGKTSFVYFASNQVFFFRKSCVLSNLVLILPPRAPSYKLIGGRMVESMFQDRSVDPRHVHIPFNYGKSKFCILIFWTLEVAFVVISLLPFLPRFVG